jgi:hypothetical protein
MSPNLARQCGLRHRTSAVSTTTIASPRHPVCAPWAVLGCLTRLPWVLVAWSPSDSKQRREMSSLPKCGSGFAKAHGYLIVAEFYDAAVSGADPIAERPGFKAMLEAP